MGVRAFAQGRLMPKFGCKAGHGPEMAPQWHGPELASASGTWPGKDAFLPCPHSVGHFGRGTRSRHCLSFLSLSLAPVAWGTASTPLLCLRSRARVRNEPAQSALGHWTRSRNRGPRSGLRVAVVVTRHRFLAADQPLKISSILWHVHIHEA